MTAPQEQVRVRQADYDLLRLLDVPASADHLLMAANHRQAAEAEAKAREAVLVEQIQQLKVDSEPSPYCPICGSCGEEGCCGAKRCLYPDTGLTEQIEELVRAVETLRSYGCPVCNGDCGSANPPVMTCPMKVAQEALTRAGAA